MTWDPDRLPGPFQAVGNTPLVPVVMTSPARRRVRVHVKLEGSNPSGSIKDRAAVAMLRGAIAEGGLRPGQVLLDASSGNMASALAAYGSALGLGVHVVCNAAVTAAKRQLIEYFGGTVILNDEGPYTYDGYRKCLKMIADSASTEGPDYHFLDQLHNPRNPAAHEGGTGAEILRQLASAALIVGSLGSGGTMLGVARAVRGAGHPARLAAVSSASGSRLPGVGAFADGDYETPFIRAARGGGLIDFWPETDMAGATAALAPVMGAGLFCGPQTGAVMCAALALSDELDLDDGIVVISGDAGWKNWAS